MQKSENNRNSNHVRHCSRSVAVDAQTASRNVAYHSQDIVAIRAKVKYTTLIVIPATEKIMEAATGDKDFWIVDVVGNFCFVHPAKPGISSNLNLITDKGNIYSFTLTDITDQKGNPTSRSSSSLPTHPTSLRPTDRRSMFPWCSLSRPASRSPRWNRTSERRWMSTRAPTRCGLKFDYSFKSNEAPFDIQSIYHDDKFTYIKTNAPEKFSVYEMRDGKPNLINYDLREGTYIIPKVMDNGYVELGKKKMEFTRKG